MLLLNQRNMKSRIIFHHSRLVFLLRNTTGSAFEGKKKVWRENMETLNENFYAAGDLTENNWFSPDQLACSGNATGQTVGTTTVASDLTTDLYG